MFKWKEEYSVNIKGIDDQHKQLFKLGKDIYELAIINDDYDRYDEIMDIIEELKNYTEYHFNYEEDLLYNNGLDAKSYAIHKLQHRMFINKIRKLNIEDIDYHQKQTLLDLITFVEDWIKQHILNTDMEYKPFLNKKGIC